MQSYPQSGAASFAIDILEYYSILPVGSRAFADSSMATNRRDARYDVVSEDSGIISEQEGAPPIFSQRLGVIIFRIILQRPLIHLSPS